MQTQAQRQEQPERQPLESECRCRCRCQCHAEDFRGCPRGSSGVLSQARVRDQTGAVVKDVKTRAMVTSSQIRAGRAQALEFRRGHREKSAVGRRRGARRAARERVRCPTGTGRRRRLPRLRRHCRAPAAGLHRLERDAARAYSWLFGADRASCDRCARGT